MSIAEQYFQIVTQTDRATKSLQKALESCEAKEQSVIRDDALLPGTKDLGIKIRGALKKIDELFTQIQNDITQTNTQKGSPSHHADGEWFHFSDLSILVKSYEGIYSVKPPGT
jgi:hypothetical protein